jgi:hypothetical protein
MNEENYVEAFYKFKADYESKDKYEKSRIKFDDYMKPSDENFWLFLIRVNYYLLNEIEKLENSNTSIKIKKGINKAKMTGTRSGKKIGRPEIKLHENFEEYYKKWKACQMTGVEFSRLIGKNRASLYRHVKYYEDKNNIENGFYRKEEPGAVLK